MDIELYYQEKGSGEPFIFLHGNGEDGTYFENQIEYSECEISDYSGESFYCK